MSEKENFIDKYRYLRHDRAMDMLCFLRWKNKGADRCQWQGHHACLCEVFTTFFFCKMFQESKCNLLFENLNDCFSVLELWKSLAFSRIWTNRKKSRLEPWPGIAWNAFMEWRTEGRSLPPTRIIGIFCFKSEQKSHYLPEFVDTSLRTTETRRPCSRRSARSSPSRFIPARSKRRQKRTFE